MTTELELCSSNIHLLLIVAIVACISVYFFIEIKKLKQNITMIEDYINYPGTKNTQKTSFFDKLINPLQTTSQVPPKTMNISPNPPPLFSPENVPQKTEIIPKDIIPEQCDINVVDMDQLNQEIKIKMSHVDNESQATNKNIDDLNDLGDNSESDHSDHSDHSDKSDLSDPSDESSEDDDKSTTSTVLDDTVVSGENNMNDTKDDYLEIDIDNIIQEYSNDDLEDSKDSKDDLEDSEDSEDDSNDLDDSKDDLKEDEKNTLKSMTVNELKTILIDLKLPVSGNKTKLISRIIENTE